MDRDSIPVARPLPEGFSLEEAFQRLACLPGCLWLDSASRGPYDAALIEESHADLGRYSFLTADPIETMEVWLGEPSPWSRLDRWCRQLPRDFDPSLPPFQGGIAGLWGYESGTWLETVGVPVNDDLPTPAISLGLYDWTIATDHHKQQSWIISQGLSAPTPSQRAGVAKDRIDQVCRWLQGESLPHPTASSTDPSTQIPDPVVFAAQHATPVEGVRSNFTSEAFRAAVNEIVQSICRGDSFQVNLAQRLIVEANSTSAELYQRLRRHNPAPFGAYYGSNGFRILSSSPEGFLRVRGNRVETRPIKGTVRRTGDPAMDEALGRELLDSDKDRAENVMIVDLLRNDLSRVCIDESVQVRQLCQLERYQYVQHLVSVVEGQLSPQTSVIELLQACFPGGSVTGAPKIEAMKTIAKLEPNPRGPYCGSIGYVGCGGNADFNILIRTITATDGYWQIPVGGGITARSDAEREEAETWAKAEGMLRAVLSNRSSAEVQSPSHCGPSRTC